MSKISLTPNATGSANFTIASPATSTDRTLTLPDNTGTIITTASTFGGTGPAFSAYLAANQNVTTTVLTKITLNTETFDTNSNFDNATNYRFTPTVAGYYQINAGAQSQATSMSAMVLNIFRNGTSYKTQTSAVGGTPAFVSLSISDVIYLNGSTDYIELYGQVNGTSPFLSGGSTVTFMSGVLVRSA